MHFRERDGIPAKAIVGNMVPPVELELEREPENPFDIYAIKVLYEGQHIGYLEKDVAAFLAPELDEGATFTCTVIDLVSERNNLYPVCQILPE
jgi:hypothetical protein